MDIVVSYSMTKMYTHVILYIVKHLAIQSRMILPIN
jgi:hypothetical protein